MRCYSAILIAVLVSNLPSASCAQEPPFREILSRLAPKDPQESMSCLRLRDGFRAELVCHEPMVSDPIAVDWGPDGRLWVVEMGDYPQGGDATGASQGRVRYLQDLDRDGRFDTSTVFLGNLSFPTSVMVWGKGVLITVAPDIVYAEDTDGDGVADIRQVLFNGFVKGNPQHQVNSLRWGLDNWIYGANGDNGGIVTSIGTGRQVDIHARDFRMRPSTGEFETQSGMAQYGRCRDDWGNWFGGRNLQPSWHCALEDHYLRRNRCLVPPDPCVDLMDPPTCPPVFPISASLPRFNEQWTLNRFTSACGIAVYRDDLFGDMFAHSYFVCEPTHNLVHHSVLYPDGVTFFSRRPAEPLADNETPTEFLASTDPWFRPVQVRTGPDGALWVVDMYRLVIEHPDFIPAKWHDQLDFDAGRGAGRIYRILPNAVNARPMPSLLSQPTAALVQALEHPNGPRRDMVQQLLVERRDPTAVEPLRKLATDSPNAKSRLTALCTLEGAGAIDVPILVAALHDAHSMVRKHAIRMGESLLNDQAALQERFLELVDDPDPQVRIQLAYSLGEWNDPRAGSALAKIAMKDADDPLMIAAIMSSATLFPGEMLRKMLERPAPTDAQVALVENLMRLVLEAEQLDVLAYGIRRVSASQEGNYDSWQFRVIAALLDALDFRGQTLQHFHQEGPRELRTAVEAANGLFLAARTAVVDSASPETRRIQAARLVGRGLEPRNDDSLLLARLLIPQTPVQLQKGVVDALAIMRPDGLSQIFLDQWSQHGPELRPRILNVLLGQKRWSIDLLERVRTGEIAVNELGATCRTKLVLHGSAEVRRMAAALLRPVSEGDRFELIERIRQQLQRPADAKRGRAVFRKHCASCHRLENEGTAIGPDLLALTDRSPEAMLTAILDPNRAVEPRFVEYSAITTSGRPFSGIVTAETGNSITLVDAQGAEHTLLRTDLDELVSTGKSLMPLGVEDLVTETQDLLDLIAYLRDLQRDPAEARNATVEAITAEEKTADAIEDKLP